MPVFTLKLNQSQPTAHRHSVFLLWPKKKTINWVDLIKKKVLLGKVRDERGALQEKLQRATTSEELPVLPSREMFLPLVAGTVVSS